MIPEAHSHAFRDRSDAATAANASDAEAALRESEERFRGTFETAAHGMGLVSPDGRWLRVNRALQEMLGYTESELLATDFQTITHPDDLDGDLVQVAALLAGEIQSYHLEKRYLRKDGKIIWILLSVSLLRGADGTPIHFISQIQDFTQRRLAEDALRESELRYRTLAENVGDIITWIALDSTRLYLSPSIRQVLGYEPEELLGKNHLEIEHPEDRAAMAAAIDAIRDGSQSAAVTSRKRRRDGSYVWCDANLSAIRDPITGQVQTIVSVARDATKRRELEEELAQARDRADQASTAKSAFLATMSHELRTPLNGVLGFAELLLDGELSVEQRQKALLLRDSGKALLAIIGDILDISKIEAGKLGLEHTPFGLSDVVAGAVTIMASEAAAKGLKIDVFLAPGLPEWVVGDPTRLRQILLNLLSNAVKFTDQGYVQVRVGREPGSNSTLLRFDIIDSGIGIADDQRHLLFEAFSQAETSISRRYGGTGLGLFICKRLVEAMGGEIGLQSRDGGGSIFSFAISLPSVVTVPAFADARPYTPSATPARILVAEDILINQTVLGAMLRHAGHKVTLVNNGAEAVEAVKKDDFDLILMDMEMPVMDGIRATSLIRAGSERMRDIPILALTAHASPDAVARGRAAGMNDHLTKPIDRQAMLAAVSKWSARGEAIPVMPTPKAEAVINEAILADLENQMGRQSLGKLMGAIREQIGAMTGILSGTSDRNAIMLQAHNMISTAGSLGLTQLMTRCRKLAEVVRRGDADIEPVVAEVLKVAGTASTEINARYPS